MTAAPAARERRLHRAIFGVAWVCALGPIWLPRALPLTGWPADLLHTARVFGHGAPVVLKLLLSIYAALLPISVAALAERMGRDRRLALFSLPLVFNCALGYGFIGFCIALPISIFALVVLDSFLAAPEGKRALAIAAASLAACALDPLLGMFVAAATIVLCAAERARPRRVALALALQLPSLLLLPARAAHAIAAVPAPFDLPREPLYLRLRNAPIRVLLGFDAPGNAYWLLLALLVAWLFLAWSARSDEESPPRTLREYRVELLFALALLFYFALPTHWLRLGAPVAAARFLSLAAIFAVLLPVGSLARARRLILLPVLAISIAYPIAMAASWVGYDRHADSFRRLLHQVPPGAATLVLIAGDGSDADADPHFQPYLQYPVYARYLTGDKRQDHQPSLTEFSLERDGARWDFILARGEERGHAVFGPDDAWRAPLRASDGDWRLYEVKR